MGDIARQQEIAIRGTLETAARYLNFTRAGTGAEWQATPENVDQLKQRLVAFVASASGGPQRYDGEDMRTAHEGMQITNEEFDMLVDHLGNRVKLYFNRTQSSGRHARFRVIGQGANTFAVGAQLDIRTGGVWQARQISGSPSGLRLIVLA